MFVVFEGIDGSGKTTLINAINEMYPDHTVVLREPGSSELGNLIRDFVKYKESANELVEALLFTAARIQMLYEHEVEQNTSTIYLCDRYFYSTYAYQRRAELLDHHLFWSLIQTPLLLRPDLTIYLKVSAETSFRRKENPAIIDFMELKDKQEVLENYNYLFNYRTDILTVDAEQPIEKVLQQIIPTIMSMYKDKFNASI